MHRWGSFMAIGDSFTEGLEDPRPDGTYRGWADRLAAMMAAERPEMTYANLGIRGNEMDDVERDQLPVVLEAKPDLVSLCAGGNDLIIPGCDIDELAVRFDALARRITDAGCDLMIFTGQDTKTIPVMSLMRHKVAVYNMHLRAIADRYRAYVVDLWGMPELRDRRAWAVDRLHLSPAGHQLVANRAAAVLGVTATGDTAMAWPPAENLTWLDARRSDVTWARQFLVPWIRRQLRGQSMGDGLAPKRPRLAPLQVPPMTSGAMTVTSD